MSYFPYIGGGLTLFVVVLALAAWIDFRRSAHKAVQEIGRIELSDIPALAQECTEVFAGKLSIQLDRMSLEDSAQKLDDAFRHLYELREAFAKRGLSWYFAMPVGAYLGELLRLHADHEWVKEEGRAPYMKVAFKDGESTVWPFEKAIKHARIGSPGDLQAYVAVGVIAARTAGRPGPD